MSQEFMKERITAMLEEVDDERVEFVYWFLFRSVERKYRESVKPD